MWSLAATTRICAVLMLCLCVSPPSAKAQSWNPIGDTWWYDNWHNENFYSGFYTFTCVGDTSLDGKLAFRFEGHSTYPSKKLPEPVKDTVFFMYEYQARYYLWDAINEEFFMLYDFNASPGDTFTVQYGVYRGYGVKQHQYPFGLDFSVTVDSIGTKVLSGESFRVLYTSPISILNNPGTLNYLFDRGSGIAESIGPLEFGQFLGKYNSGDLGNWSIGFRCYQRADGFSLRGKTFPIQYACDFSLGIDNPFHPELTVLFSPNPASEFVTAQLPQNFSRQGGMAYLYDHTGRLMVQLALSPGQDNLMVDVSTFPSGIYFINLESPDGGRLAGKIVKQ